MSKMRFTKMTSMHLKFLSKTRSRDTLLLVSLFIATFNGAVAQTVSQIDTLHDRTVALSKIGEHIALGRFAEMFEDVTATMSYDDIQRSVRADQFQPLADNKLSFGFNKSAFWFRFLISNDTAEPTTRWLEVADSRLQYVDVYWKDASGLFSHQPGGGMRARAYQDIRSFHHVFPVTLDAHETRAIYVRAASGYAVVAPLHLWKPLAYAEHSRLYSIKLILFFGIFFGLFAFNFLLWLTLRDASYGWYTVFLASITVNY